jgi:hypothetical protein
MLRSLGRRLDTLESEVVAPMIATVQLLDKKVRDSHDDDDAAGMQKGHQPWKCEACRSLLGYYDAVKDLLRIRVKDYHVQVKLGVDGFVEVPCRRCGHVNHEAYSPPRG